MSIYTDRKTGRLFIQFEYQGEPHKKRLPAGTTKRQAQQLEVKLKNKLFFENAGMAEKEGTLWQDFVVDVFLPHVEANKSPAALEKAIVICRESMPYLKGKLITEIKVADLEQFKSERMQTLTRHGHVRKPATIRREMSVLSSVFAMALKNDLCDYNPCSRLDLPSADNVQDRVLEVEDWDRFFKGFRNSLQRDICTVVLFTGLRQNDVLGLSKDHVNWQTGTIRLLQGKTRRKVNIDMNDAVRGILERRRDNDSLLFFPSYRTGKQLKSIKHGIKFACIRAGLEPLTIRDLRRSFGTLLHECGYDDSTVAQLLGHSDLRSIHRYKRGTKIKKEAVAMLGNLAESAKIPTTALIEPIPNDPNSLQTLVEMRRIELLASALRTEVVSTVIH
jgi:integrase